MSSLLAISPAVFRHRLLPALINASLLAVGVSTVAWAQPVQATSSAQSVRSWDIPPGPLDTVLTRFAAESGVSLSFSAQQVAGRRSLGVSGEQSVAEALAKLLAGTGLVAEPSVDGVFRLRAIPEGAVALPAVKVNASSVAERAWGPVQGYVARNSSTGSKSGAAIVETPQSVSVIASERIEAMGAALLKDALAYTPSIDIAPYGTDSRYDWITIRGFDAYSPGFYQDGLQLRNNAWWAVWQTENYGVERIEVMRGPSSVLYGQNGPGGMINLVSKRPTTERRNELQLQLGSDSRKQIAADLSGPVNAEGSMLYRVVGLARDAEMSDEEMPDDRTYFAPSLTLQPSERTSLTLQAQLLRSRAGTYVRSVPEAGSLVPTPAGTYVPTDVYIGEPDFNRLEQDQWQLGYSLEHRFSNRLTVRQNLRYADLDMVYDQVFKSDYQSVNADPTDPQNYRVVTRGVNGSDEAIRSLVVDNQAQLQFDRGQLGQTVLIGLDYQNSRFDQASYFSGSVEPLDLYAPVYGQPVVPGPTAVDTWTRLEQTGLYLQDQLKWGHWVAMLAGRYDRATIDNDDHLIGIDTHQSDGKFTGRAGVVYLHPSGWAPYASYSTSFSPVTTIDPSTNKPFDPETGRQIEAGVRYQPNSYPALFSAAVFDLRRQNYISYEPLNFIPGQTGEITVRGLELEAVVTPIEGFNLTAAYAYTPKADVTESENPDEIGKQSSAVSEHRLSLWGDYRFTSGIKVGVGARYVGSTNGINESAVTEVPGYTLVDALLGYEFDRWNLALNAQNLTDKEYITNCGFGSCYLGTERRLLLTTSYRW